MCTGCLSSGHAAFFGSDLFTGRPEACCNASGHALRLLRREHAARTSFEGRSANWRAPPSEVLTILGPDLAPQPSPHLLDRVEIWRGCRHAPCHNACLPHGPFACSCVEKGLVVAQHRPRPLALDGFEGLYGLRQLAASHLTAPLTRGELARAVKGDKREATFRQPSPERRGAIGHHGCSSWPGQLHHAAAATR